MLRNVAHCVHAAASGFFMLATKCVDPKIVIGNADTQKQDDSPDIPRFFSLLVKATVFITTCSDDLQRFAAPETAGEGVSGEPRARTERTAFSPLRKAHTTPEAPNRRRGLALSTLTAAENMNKHLVPDEGYCVVCKVF